MNSLRRRRRFPTSCSVLRVTLLLAALLLHHGCSGATATTEELFGVATNTDHDDDDSATSENQDDPPKKNGVQHPQQTASTTTTSTTGNKDTPPRNKKVVWGSNNNGNNNKTHNMVRPSLPFVKTIHHEPPSGFAIKARVYTDATDKLAHVDVPTSANLMTIPYFDCGIDGETTSGLPILAAYWRHARSKPSAFTTRSTTATTSGRHPQLLVCLSKARLEVNSGEVLDLESGDVVLLENVVGGGHKIYPTAVGGGAGEGESGGGPPTAMTVLILTLPIHYHSIGKDKSCLEGLIQSEDDDDDNSKNSKMKACSFGKDGDDDQSNHTPLVGPRTQELLQFPTKLRRHVRKWALGMIGATLSSVTMTFLSRQTAVWLSILVGGACFVAGSTYAFVQAGDYLLDKMELSHSEKLLREAMVSDDADDDEDDEDLLLERDVILEDDIAMETLVLMDEDDEENETIEAVHDEDALTAPTMRT